MIKKLWISLLLITAATGCATGVSTYKYYHNADGSTSVEIKSANEIDGGMEMGINRETGTLEVKIGTLTKNSDTVEVVGSVERIIHDVTTVVPK